MKEFTLKDVTYDKSLDKKYNFTTIFDEPTVAEEPMILIANSLSGTGRCSEFMIFAHKHGLYKNKNLTATRANNLMDGKEK